MLRTTVRLTALSAAAFALTGTTAPEPVAAAEAPLLTSAIAMLDAADAAPFDIAFSSLPAVRAAPPPPPEHAVDLDTIEPTIEVEPAAAAIAGGRASYYGSRFNGRRTASGERFDMNAMTAAHRTLPFGSRVRVTNPRTGKSVVVRINDRGPFHGNRVIDVSRAAASEIGMVASGTARVELALIG